jgi:5-amino-6-(5-phospho-D-ribitylamino)uracil phosphatase
MNRKIKLAVLDMDGTLLSNQHQISIQNKEAVKKALQNGVDVIIATGRSLPAVDMFAEELELNDFIITGNGSEIWHLHGPELIERSSLENEMIEMMWKVRNKHGANHWAASVGKVWKREMPEKLHEHEWLKFGYDLDSIEVKQAILEELQQYKELEISNSSPLNIEVNAKGVHKAKAIESVLQRKNFSFEEVMTIGDSLNDMSMIKAAGTGVAMGNAQQEVKDAADHVTSSNVEHGVAEAFEYFRII